MDQDSLAIQMDSSETSPGTEEQEKRYFFCLEIVNPDYIKRYDIFLKLCMLIGMLVSFFCIYFFVNQVLVTNKNRIDKETPDKLTVAKLIILDDQYYFHYGENICVIENIEKQYIDAFTNNTFVTIYISDDKKHCSIDRKKSDGVEGLLLFNILFSLFGVSFVMTIVVCLCGFFNRCHTFTIYENFCKRCTFSSMCCRD
jgi:hypothetical protein